MVAILRGVHEGVGLERAGLLRELGLPSGFGADTIARLVSLRLIEERPAPLSGGRGRPTTTLHPHPVGPLVVVACVSHERWSVAVAGLGGAIVEERGALHGGDAAAVFADLRGELRRVRRRHGRRLAAVAISVPGTVSGLQLAEASSLGWRELDLGVLWPGERSGHAVLAGNDASFAAVAESRRGAAASANVVLHLFMDAGIGGAVIERRRILAGAHGMAGEFGHMPFAGADIACRCGATGCWGAALDGRRLAALLAAKPPKDEVSYARRVLAAARSGERGAVGAVNEIAEVLGRGIAGLVNATDPDVVTLGGLGREVIAVATPTLDAAYRRGIMRFRAGPPPPIVPAHFGEEAPLIGAVESAFDLVLSDEGVRAWSERFEV